MMTRCSLHSVSEPAEKYSYLSSRLVKEIFRHGGSVRGLVPKRVEERLHSKVGRASQPASSTAVKRGKRSK